MSRVQEEGEGEDAREGENYGRGHSGLGSEGQRAYESAHSCLDFSSVRVVYAFFYITYMIYMCKAALVYRDMGASTGPRAQHHHHWDSHSPACQTGTHCHYFQAFPCQVT